MFCNSNTVKAEETNHYYSPCCSNYKKPIVVALEIILGGACIGIGAYLAHLYGIGTTDILGIVGGGVVGVGIIAITSLVCMRTKNKSSSADPLNTHSTQPAKAPVSKKRVIKGNIAVSNYRTTGSLGEDTSNLHILHLTHKVQRIDGNDWTTFPNEMLIEFQISNITEKKSPLQNNLTFHLPFCLFIKNDDYLQWKKDGETVEFDYDGYRYELTIAQEESHLKTSFEQIIQLCEREFYMQHERSILPLSFHEIENPNNVQKGYLSPMDIQKHRNAAKTSAELKERFETDFSVTVPLEFPVMPKYRLTSAMLICELPCVEEEDIHYYYTDTAVAIYAPRQKLDVHADASAKVILNGIELDPKEFPELWPAEYLLIINFDEKFTRNMIEHGDKSFDKGVLQIVFHSK